MTVTRFTNKWPIQDIKARFSWDKVESWIYFWDNWAIKAFNGFTWKQEGGGISLISYCPGPQGLSKLVESSTESYCWGLRLPWWLKLQLWSMIENFTYFQPSNRARVINRCINPTFNASGSFKKTMSQNSLDDVENFIFWKSTVDGVKIVIDFSFCTWSQCIGRLDHSFLPLSCFFFFIDTWHSTVRRARRFFAAFSAGCWV